MHAPSGPRTKWSLLSPAWDWGVMPISRADFERGRAADSDEDKVLQLLDGDRSRAYTSKEIAKLIGHESATSSAGDPAVEEMGKVAWHIIDSTRDSEFRGFLDGLVNAGKIERRLVQKDSIAGWYYSCKP